MAEIPFTSAGYIKLTKLGQAIDKHISNLHRARLAGRLPCVKILGEWYTDQDSWDAFLKRGNGGSAATQPDVPAVRSESQRRRDDERAARQCELMGV